MSTYSVYNIKIDNNLSFPSGVTAGYVLAINSNGSTYWAAGGAGNQTLAQTLALGNNVGGNSIIATSGSISLENQPNNSYIRIGESDRFTTITQGLQGTSGRANIILDGGSQTASIASKINISSEVTELAGAFRPPAGPQTDSKIIVASQSITLNSGAINGDPSDTQIRLDNANKVINIDASAVNFSANPSYSVALSYNTYLYGLTNSVLAVDANGKIIATSSSGGSVPTYASYSVSGSFNQNLSGVSVTRLKLTGDTTYNFGTASTSQPYSYIVDAGTYKFNLGTYSSYKISPSDFPIIGATGAGLSGSFILNGLFDGTSMWIKSELGFFDMPIPPSGGGTGSDADATAYLSAVTTAGGTVNETITTAVNTLFTSLKSNNLYTKIYALYPFVGSTTAACAIEAKGTTSYNLTYVGSGASANSNGLSGNGTSVGKLNVAPSSFFTSADNIHISYYSRTSRAANASFSLAPTGPIDTDFNSKRLQLNILYDSNTYLVIGSLSSVVAYTDTGTTGFYIGSRTAQNSLKLYKNGSMVSQNTNSNTNLLSSTPASIGLLGSIYDNAVSAPDELQSAFISLGSGLTDGEASTFNTIVQTFQTSLGRNV
jgi:hypothetical protein